MRACPALLHFLSTEAQSIQHLIETCTPGGLIEVLNLVHSHDDCRFMKQASVSFKTGLGQFLGDFVQEAAEAFQASRQTHEVQCKSVIVT